MHRIPAALAALLATSAALVGLSVSSASAAPTFLSVRTADFGKGAVPTSVQAQNLGQSAVTIVISSTTPAVCKVPTNTQTVGAYQSTPSFAVTLVGKGTCTLRATSGLDVVERSYTVR